MPIYAYTIIYMYMSIYAYTIIYMYMPIYACTILHTSPNIYTPLHTRPYTHTSLYIACPYTHTLLYTHGTIMRDINIVDGLITITIHLVCLVIYMCIGRQLPLLFWKFAFSINNNNDSSYDSSNRVQVDLIFHILSLVVWKRDRSPTEQY